MIVTVIMGAMAVVMIMGVAMLMDLRRRIGAALGLERRIDQRDPGAKGRQQSLDGEIALGADAVWQKLHCNVTVAEMPGQPRQRAEIGGTHLEQWLRRRHHFDQCAILKHQEVVGPKPHRAVQIDLDRGAFGRGDHHPGRAPLSGIEDHGIGDGSILTLIAGNDARGARHEK